MSAPKTDRAAVEEVLAAMETAGWKVVEVEGEYCTNPADAIMQIIDFDECRVYFQREEHVAGIMFVLDNSPEDVVCDYNVSLEPVIDPILDRWGR